MSIQKITLYDVERFTYGSCYQLAEAIHDATGWPMYAFWDEYFRDYDIHAFVKTPRGTFLDVTGEHTRYRMLRKWQGRHIRRIRDSYNMRSWDIGNPFFDSLPRAREIVPALLADYNNCRLGTCAGTREEIGMIYHGATESLADLEKNVRCVTAGLREHADAFDFIAVSGMSGALVGAPAALRLRKPLVVVRKDTDENLHHAGGTLIGWSEARGRYVIVDDFVSSGRTLDFIRAHIDRRGIAYEDNETPPKYVGYFSYADDMWIPELT